MSEEARNTLKLGACSDQGASNDPEALMLGDMVVMI